MRATTARGREHRLAQHQRETWQLRGPRTWWDLSRQAAPAPAFRMFFQCACGRRVPALDPSLDPRRLRCRACGARGPTLRQELVRGAA